MLRPQLHWNSSRWSTFGSILKESWLFAKLDWERGMRDSRGAIEFIAVAFPAHIATFISLKLPGNGHCDADGSDFADISRVCALEEEEKRDGSFTIFRNKVVFNVCAHNGLHRKFVNHKSHISDRFLPFFLLFSLFRMRTSGSGNLRSRAGQRDFRGANRAFVRSFSFVRSLDRSSFPELYRPRARDRVNTRPLSHFPSSLPTFTATL